jgi:hypothetical protein
VPTKLNSETRGRSSAVAANTILPTIAAIVTRCRRVACNASDLPNVLLHGQLNCRHAPSIVLLFNPLRSLTDTLRRPPIIHSHSKAGTPIDGRPPRSPETEDGREGVRTRVLAGAREGGSTTGRQYTLGAHLGELTKAGRSVDRPLHRSLSRAGCDLVSSRTRTEG